MVMSVTGRQIKAARMLLAWSAADLARRSGLTVNTIVALELDRSTRDRSWQVVRQALEDAGIEWLEGGVQLKPKPRKRSRKQ